MNTTDRNLLIVVTVIGIAGSLYMRNRAKHNFPIKILGLDASNSQKLVIAVTVLTGSILLIGHLGKEKTV